MVSKIVKHVLEAKIQDLPFSVLKNSIDFEITPEMFLDYCNYIYIDEKITDWNRSCWRSPRLSIEDSDLKYFPGWDKVVKDLSRLYGNINNYYISLMQTGDKSINTTHALLHNDEADVIHINCFGRVEWTLVDPNDINQTEHKVILEPGDLLYMRGMTLHETFPLSRRGSLIFMTLPLVIYNGLLDAVEKKEKLIESIKKDLSEGKHV
jgi:hypothetical protein